MDTARLVFQPGIIPQLLAIVTPYKKRLEYLKLEIKFLH